MAKRMRLKSCSRLSASRNRFSGEGPGQAWGLLMEVGSLTSGPSPGPSSLRPAGSVAGITCLTSGSRSNRRTTWPRCWTRSIRKRPEHVGPVAASVPGKNKMLVVFLFSSCNAQLLPSLFWGDSSFLPPLCVPAPLQEQIKAPELHGEEVW